MIFPFFTLFSFLFSSFFPSFSFFCSSFFFSYSYWREEVNHEKDGLILNRFLFMHIYIWNTIGDPNLFIEDPQIFLGDSQMHIGGHKVWFSDETSVGVSYERGSPIVLQ